MIYKSKIFKKLAEDEKDQNISSRKKELDNILNKYNMEESTVPFSRDDVANPELPKRLTKGLIVKYIADNIGATLTKKISENSSFIGSGVYSAVYHCVYNGKPAALKITDWKNDYKAYSKLSSIHNSLGEYSKYFVNIYLLKEIQASNKTYYVIVSELLNPLESSIKEELFSNKFSAENSILPKDKELTVDRYNYYKRLIIDFVNTDMSSESDNPIFKYLDVEEDGIKKNYNNLISFILKRITKITRETPSLIIDSIYKEIVIYIITCAKGFYEDKSNAVNYVKSIIDDLFRFTFRINIGQKVTKDNIHTTIDVESEDFSDFNKALALAVRKGFVWNDLHRDNIMQRPGTKIPVISDVGLFDVY